MRAMRCNATHDASPAPSHYTLPHPLPKIYFQVKKKWDWITINVSTAISDAMCEKSLWAPCTCRMSERFEFNNPARIKKLKFSFHPTVELLKSVCLSRILWNFSLIILISKILYVSINCHMVLSQCDLQFCYIFLWRCLELIGYQCSSAANGAYFKGLVSANQNLILYWFYSANLLYSYVLC